MFIVVLVILVDCDLQSKKISDAYGKQNNTTSKESTILYNTYFRSLMRLFSMSCKTSFIECVGGKDMLLYKLYNALKYEFFVSFKPRVINTIP